MKRTKRGIGSVRVLGVLIGVVMVLVSLAGLVGYIPGLSVACTSATGCSSEVVSADFTTTVSGLTVTLTDKSTVVLDGTTDDSSLVSKIMIAWGDYTVQFIKVGATVTHQYSTSGSYYIDDFVWGNFSSDPPNFVNFTSYGYAVAVSSGGTSQTEGYSLHAAVSYTQANASITVRDSTTETNVTGLSITVNWGDGTSATIAQDGTLSHTYAKPSNATSNSVTFPLTETATGTAQGKTVTSTASDPVTVTFSSSCTTTACQCASANPPASCTPSPPPATTTTSLYFNALVGLLLLTGAALIVVFVIPGINPKWATLGVVLALAVGTGLGWAIGGPGPL